MSDIIGIIANGKSIATKAGIKGSGEKVTKKLIGVNFEKLIEKGIIEIPEKVKEIQESNVDHETVSKVVDEQVEIMKEEIKDEVKVIKKPVVVGAVKK
jgi:hypothetical protein